jgi:hypothetical protein
MSSPPRGRGCGAWVEVRRGRRSGAGADPAVVLINVAGSGGAGLELPLALGLGLGEVALDPELVALLGIFRYMGTDPTSQSVLEGVRQIREEFAH